MAKNLYSMTTDELRSLAGQNSAAWYGADKTTQDALHQQNVEINKILDSRSGNTSTFDSGTGTWKSSGGSGTSSYVKSGYGSYNASPSYDYSTTLGEMTRSGSTETVLGSRQVNPIFDGADGDLLVG